MYNGNNNYYYMVTRDTNIVVLDGDISDTWEETENKPFTFTGQHNGVDNSNNYTWDINSLTVVARNDTTIEYLKILGVPINDVNIQFSGVGAENKIYGNYNNFKIGRGLVRERKYNKFRSCFWRI